MAFAPKLKVLMRKKIAGIPVPVLAAGAALIGVAAYLRYQRRGEEPEAPEDTFDDAAAYSEGIGDAGAVSGGGNGYYGDVGESFYPPETAEAYEQPFDYETFFEPPEPFPEPGLPPEEQTRRFPPDRRRRRPPAGSRRRNNRAAIRAARRRWEAQQRRLRKDRRSYYERRRARERAARLRQDERLRRGRRRRPPPGLTRRFPPVRGGRVIPIGTIAGGGGRVIPIGRIRRKPRRRRLPLRRRTRARR